MSKIKVVICDDMKHIRDYFSIIIDAESDMEVVGLAESGEEAIKIVEKTMPNIVLMDIQMESEEAGIIATEIIKKKCPDIKIIVITIHLEDEFIFKAYGAGAVDYILKTALVEEIPAAIRQVHENKEFIRPFIAEKIRNEFSRLQKQQQSLFYSISVIMTLTTAEIEILKEIYNGESRQQIAKKRFVSEVTVKTQISNILKKLKYKSTKELISDLKQLQLFELLKKI